MLQDLSCPSGFHLHRSDPLTPEVVQYLMIEAVISSAVDMNTQASPAIFSTTEITRRRSTDFRWELDSANKVVKQRPTTRAHIRHSQSQSDLREEAPRPPLQHICNNKTLKWAEEMDYFRGEFDTLKRWPNIPLAVRDSVSQGLVLIDEFRYVVDNYRFHMKRSKGWLFPEATGPLRKDSEIQAPAITPLMVDEETIVEGSMVASKANSSGESRRRDSGFESTSSPPSYMSPTSPTWPVIPSKTADSGLGSVILRAPSPILTASTSTAFPHAEAGDHGQTQTSNFGSSTRLREQKSPRRKTLSQFCIENSATGRPLLTHDQLLTVSIAIDTTGNALHDLGSAIHRLWVVTPHRYQFSFPNAGFLMGRYVDIAEEEGSATPSELKKLHARIPHLVVTLSAHLRTQIPIFAGVMGLELSKDPYSVMCRPEVESRSGIMTGTLPTPGEYAVMLATKLATKTAPKPQFNPRTASRQLFSLSVALKVHSLLYKTNIYSSHHALRLFSRLNRRSLAVAPSLPLGSKAEAQLEVVSAQARELARDAELKCDYMLELVDPDLEVPRGRRWQRLWSGRTSQIERDLDRLEEDVRWEGVERYIRMGRGLF